MENKKKFLFMIVTLILSIGISTIVLAINNKIEAKGTFYIDKPLNIYVFNKNSIDIEGWWMATDKNAIMKIYIDGKDTKADVSKRIKRTDVLDAIKGYGDEEINPLPGFKTTINITTLTEGKHTLTYQLENQDGIVLAKEEKEITIDRSVKGTFDIDTPNHYQGINNIKENKITIQGWMMATDKNVTMKIAVDGKTTNATINKRISRPDVLNAVKGYGDKTTNPNPGFEIIIDVSQYEQGKHQLQYELQTIEGKIIAKKTGNIVIKKGELDIDTPNIYKKAQTVKEENLNIKGWYMTSDITNQLKIYIDGNKVNASINRTLRPDVLKAIKGYGGQNSNPKPGFETTINLSKIPAGNHEILYRLETIEGKIIAEKKGNILIKKGEFDIDTPNPYKKQTIIKENTIIIKGWYLANNPKATMKISIDGKEVNIENLKRVPRPDVLSAISGYGGNKKNPLPGFEVCVNLDNYISGKHEILYELVDEDGSKIADKKSTINLKKGEFEIDTPHNQKDFYGKEIKIEGWYLANNKNVTMKIYIDNEETKAIVQKRKKRPDVLSAINGYGGIEVNPLPGFEMSVDISSYTVGKHKLKYSLETMEGELIAERNLEIFIDNTDRGTLYLEIPSKIDVEYGVSLLQGWEMSTYPNSTIEVKIDGKKINNEINRVKRPDVIKAITNYGNITTNPTPGFNTYIDFTKYNLGKHKLEVILYSTEGKELSKIQKTINIFKNITHGIDVSEFNKLIDWRAVKQTQDFAIIRVGYRGYRNPVLVSDSQFYRNIQSAQTVGLNCGIYFVSQAINEQEAIEEANWVVNIVSHYNIKYPIVLDSEWSNGKHDGRADYLDKWQRTTIAKTFLQTIRDRGYTPAIYASRDWLYNQLDTTQLTDFDTWVAHYTNDINKKTDYKGAYTMWQYTSTGRINGVNGNVDRNICYKRYI